LAIASSNSPARTGCKGEAKNIPITIIVREKKVIFFITFFDWEKLVSAELSKNLKYPTILKKLKHIYLIKHEYLKKRIHMCKNAD
jgi:hypothetical protein